MANIEPAHACQQPHIINRQSTVAARRIVRAAARNNMQHTNTPIAYRTPVLYPFPIRALFVGVPIFPIRSRNESRRHTHLCTTSFTYIYMYYIFENVFPKKRKYPTNNHPKNVQLGVHICNVVYGIGLYIVFPQFRLRCYRF